MVDGRVSVASFAGEQYSRVMSEIMIDVQGVGKKFRLGGATSTGRLSDVVGSLWGGGQQKREDVQRDYWALKDISFQVTRGESCSIIGKNGAGKSTLLKILTRITKPTTGRFGLVGHVGSLLEVGTGFHPDLTGRENIMMSGVVLGMSRSQIRDRFDEIVDFAGVDKFLDTQVKRYSSGMQVRLGFAVAAHLEPEILLIDEVLAVGDYQFQKKCMGKINLMTRQGRTILFVSHDLAAVRTVSTRCLLLQGGELIFDGTTESSLKKYQQDSEQSDEVDLRLLPRHPALGADRVVSFTKIRRNSVGPLTTRSALSLSIELEGHSRVGEASVLVLIGLADGTRLATLSSLDSGLMISWEDHQTIKIDVLIEKHWLAPGLYQIGLVCVQQGVTSLDWVGSAMTISVEADLEDVPSLQRATREAMGMRIPSQMSCR